MKRKTLPRIVASLILGATLLGGCGSTYMATAPSSNMVTITGVPLSVEVVANDYYAHFAAVVEDQYGEARLGYVRRSSLIGNAVEASALVESEINDVDKFGQKDPISLTGILKSDGLQIKQVRVHGYTIEF